MSEFASDLGVESVFGKAIVELGADRRPQDLLHCPAGAAGRPARNLTRTVTSHHMNCPELVLALEGSPSIATPVETFNLRPGQLLLIEPGVEHGGFPEDQSGSYVFLVCHIFNTVAHLDLITPDRHLALGLVGTTDLKPITEAISREMSGRDLEWESAVQLLLKYLACVLSRRLRGGSYLLVSDRPMNIPDGNQSAWNVIERVLLYCSAHFHRPLRVGEIAAHVGYCPGYLDRLFSRHTGRSIAKHLRDLRMAHAMDLLANSRLPATQIARSIGHSHYANFRRAFVAAVGCSPKQYRRGDRSQREGRNDISEESKQRNQAHL